jgi:hypothetical protein
MSNLLSNRSSSIRSNSYSRAEQKAAYRFLDNDKVSENVLVSSCTERTSVLSKDRHVLVLNDTTEINLESHAGRLKPGSGIGLVGNNSDIGFFAHLGLVIDAITGTALGYSSIRLWYREQDKLTKEARGYSTLPVEEKESYKWIQCCKDSKTLLGATAASITIVGDRESDMYELFTDAQSMGVAVIARSRINRNTSEGKELYALLEKEKITGNSLIKVEGDVRKQTKNRVAKLAIKYTQVSIAKPKNKSNDQRVNKIKVWIVEAKEIGKTNGICWRILTTHPITTIEQAKQIIEWYKQRWFIEEVHRLLKNKGFKIEDSQLESGWAIRKLTILLLQNILRIMQMLVAYATEEQQDVGLVFDKPQMECLSMVAKKMEGKTEKLKNNHPVETLKWATWVIARLGGWSGYTSQRKPGPITLKTGLDKFNAIFYGWALAKDVGTQ